MTPRPDQTAGGLEAALRHCEHSSRPRPAGMAGMGLVAILATAAMWLVHEIVAIRTGRPS